MSRKRAKHTGPPCGLQAALSPLRRILAAVLVTTFIPLGAPGAEAMGQKDGDTDTDDGLTIENEMTMGVVGDNGVTAAERVMGEDDNRAFFVAHPGLRFRNQAVELGAVLSLRMYPFSPSYLPTYLGSADEDVAAYDFDNDFRLDRVWYRYRTSTVDIRFGDMSVTLGKGIAFHADGESDGWDRMAVRGASLVFEKPGRALLGGYAGTTNGTDIDPVTRSVLEAEPADSVFALQAQIHAAEVLKLGMHGVYIEPRYRSAEHIAPDELWVDRGPGIRIAGAGALTDFRLGGLSLYLEGNVQSHDNFRTVSGEAVRNEVGYAGYGAMAWDSGPYLRRMTLQISAEGMVYRKFLSEGTYRSGFGAYRTGPVVRYHQMPTLEPDWILIPSQGNETGVRFEAALRLKRRDTRLSLSSSYILYKGSITPTGRWDGFRDVRTVHPLFSVVQPLQRRDSELSVEFGYRYEAADHTNIGYSSSGYLLHGTARVFTRFDSGYGVGVFAGLRRHRLGVIERNDNYRVSDNGLIFALPRHWRFDLGLQYSDELTGADKQSLRLPGNLHVVKNWFVHGKVGYEGAGMFEFLTVSLQGGTTRGGYRCNSGSCRIFPDSVEALLTVQYRL